jgi:hypothetical protein
MRLLTTNYHHERSTTMPAVDIEAKVREWVGDEVQKQSFTDVIGWLVYPSRELVPNQQAGRVEQFTHWHIDLSMKTGLVGKQKMIRKLSTITSTEPDEDRVRKTVAEAVEILRQFRTQLKAPSNGHGNLPVKGRG